MTRKAAKTKRPAKAARPVDDGDGAAAPIALPRSLLDPSTPYRAATTALGQAAERLRDALRGSADLAPHDDVAFVLNPLDHAWERHLDYLERHGPAAGKRVEAVLLGMNPGPWGMAQTGVPFGSPDLVKEFLGISGPVRRVTRTHESRPILGFEGERTEVSGQRLWGGVRDCFGTPGPFFARLFVLNYCPLVLQSATGANVTPDKHAKLLRDPFEACDAHLADALSILRPTTLIGVGAWAAKQGARVIEAHGLDVKVGAILHPSPASPAANRGWLPAVLPQLQSLGHPWPAPRG